jgi:hypothetical protein
MSGYGSALRKSLRWYKKLGVEFILGTTVVNAWVIYNQFANKKTKMTKFREDIIRALFAEKDNEDGVPERQVKSGLHQRDQPNSTGDANADAGKDQNITKLQAGDVHVPHTQNAGTSDEKAESSGEPESKRGPGRKLQSEGHGPVGCPGWEVKQNCRGCLPSQEGFESRGGEPRESGGAVASLQHVAGERGRSLQRSRKAEGKVRQGGR